MISISIKNHLRWPITDDNTLFLWSGPKPLNTTGDINLEPERLKHTNVGSTCHLDEMNTLIKFREILSWNVEVMQTTRNPDEHIIGHTKTIHISSYRYVAGDNKRGGNSLPMENYGGWHLLIMLINQDIASQTFKSPHGSPPM